MAGEQLADGTAKTEVFTGNDRRKMMYEAAKVRQTETKT
jgi:hypothetical protein